MSTVLFTNNMELNVPIEQGIRSHFDEIMALYDLMYTCKDFTVFGDIHGSIITFRIECDTKDVSSILNIIHNKTVSKYNRNFICTAESINDSVSVRLAS